MEPIFIKKLKEVIREEISNDNRIEIDGLGQFYKVHQKQVQKKTGDGRIVLLPPKDMIEFKPEINQSNDNQ